MKRAFLVSLYMLCLAIGCTVFARAVNVENLGMLAKATIGTLGTVLIALSIYLTYRVTRSSASKQS